MKTLMNRLLEKSKKNKFTPSLDSKKEFDKAMDKLHKQIMNVNNQ